MNIYQGSNSPIVLQFEEDISQILDFSAVLVPKYGLRTDKDIGVIKKWSAEDIEIYDNNTIILGLTQEETLAFPSITCNLEVKLSTLFNVDIVATLLINIYRRSDTTILNIDG